MSGLLYILAGALYLGGTAGYIVYLWRQREVAARVSAWLMAAGLALQTAGLVAAWSALGHIPAITLKHSLGLLAWSLVAGFLAVQVRVRVKVLGSFVAPLALFLMILAWAQPEGGVKPISAFASAWLVGHVISAFLGDAMLALTAIAGAMYLLQEKQIKSKKPGWIYSRLPSLTTLDSLSRSFLMVGFPLLTLGMLTGAVFGEFISGSYWRWAPKEVWSLIAWLVYAVIIHQRLTVGWQGRKAAWLSIVGFAIVLFTFLGASFLFDDYHNFSTYGQPQ